MSARRSVPCPTKPAEVEAFNEALRALRVAAGGETWRGLTRGGCGAYWDLWPGRGMTDGAGGDRLVLSGTRLTRGRLGVDVTVLCGDERLDLRVRHPTLPTMSSLTEAIAMAVAWAVARGAVVPAALPSPAEATAAAAGRGR